MASTKSNVHKAELSFVSTAQALPKEYIMLGGYGCGVYSPRSAGDSSKSSNRYSSTKPPPVSYGPVPMPWAPPEPIRTDVNLARHRREKTAKRFGK